MHNYTGDHPLRCKVFQNKPVKERIEITKLNKACMACLEISHNIEDYSKGFKCTVIKGCGAKHNNLLHEEKPIAGSVNHFDDKDEQETILPTMASSLNAVKNVQSSNIVGWWQYSVIHNFYICIIISFKGKAGQIKNHYCRWRGQSDRFRDL